MPIQTLTESVDHLTAEVSTAADKVTHLEAEIALNNAALRRDIRQKTVTTRIAIALMFVILLCSLAAAFKVSLDNTRAIEANNQKFCPLVLLLIPKPGEAQATTPRGIELQTNAKTVAREFGCL